MSTPFTINLILSGLGIVLYGSGAVWIFRQSYRNSSFPRARRALAVLLCMWGLFAAVCVFDSSHTGLVIDSSLMSITTLLIGGFSMIASLIYPLELAHPGWATLRSIIRLALPFTLLTAFYYLVLAILGQPIRDLNNMDELLLGIGQFNIWFRFVLYLAVCLYLALLFLNTSLSALRFEKQSTGDNTPIDPHQAAWLRTYAIGQSCIAVAYLGLLLHGSIWAQVIHRTIALVFFGIVIYMVGFSKCLNQKPEIKA